jgi:drug/metabolite transporter (DMT)-like permease
MLLMAAFVALWAVAEALPGRARLSYSPYQVVWTRYAVHLALMLAVWGWREPGSLWRTRRPIYQLARSMLMVGMPASFIMALGAGVSYGTLMSIFWLSPLLILALAKIILGERAPASIWLVCAIGSGGAILLSAPGPFPRLSALVYPFGMAATFSLYVVMTRSLRSETTRANLFYTALGVFLVLTPLMPRVWRTPVPHDLVLLAGVGGFGYLGLWALDRLAATAPVSMAAPVAYLQLVFAATIGIGLGNHGPAAAGMVGVVLIAAIAVYLWARAPRLTVQGAV